MPPSTPGPNPGPPTPPRPPVAGYPYGPQLPTRPLTERQPVTATLAVVGAGMGVAMALLALVTTASSWPLAASTGLLALIEAAVAALLCAGAIALGRRRIVGSALIAGGCVVAVVTTLAWSLMLVLDAARAVDAASNEPTPPGGDWTGFAELGTWMLAAILIAVIALPALIITALALAPSTLSWARSGT